MYRRISYIAIFACILLGLTSCSKEGCMTPQSENFNPNAKKDNGSCELWKNRFLGDYIGTWKCNADQKEMTVTVADEEGDNVSLLLTFNDGSHHLIAKVNAKNSFKIEEQPYTAAGVNYTASGIGVLNTNSTITFECKYMLNGFETEACTFSGSK